MKSKYEAFSHVYEVMNYDFPYDLWIDVIHPYNKQTSILDVGCGTGEILKRLDAKIKIGIDNSERMIEIAKDNNPSASYKVRDMRDFKLAMRFDLIIATADVLNYVNDMEELKRVLNTIKSHLSDDGVFIFDMHSEFKIMNDFNSEIYMDETERITYIWEVMLGEKPLSIIHDLTFFIKSEEDLYKKFKETHYQQGFTHEEVLLALDQLGMEIISTFSDFEEQNGLAEMSERNFFVVKIK